jgi:starch synthase
MKILHITPELTPWSKAGGLGDATAGLVKALTQEQHQIRVVTPLYGSIAGREDFPILIPSLKVHVAGDPAKAHCRIRQTSVTEKCEAWFIEHEDYYGSSEIYPAREDAGERAAFLSRAALDICLAMDWIPDVIHCHDWTTGLVPVLLNTTAKGTFLGRTASVLTIHNLQHQGIHGRRILPFLNLPEWLYHPDELECFGGINFLKGGILHATKVTTVSPTYAKEILTPAYGFGLDEYIRRRQNDLEGILNGVDGDDWDPQTDPHIAQNFSGKKLAGKKACKLDLQKKLNLDPNPNLPLIGVVSRLWEQKGLDLTLHPLRRFLQEGKIQFVLLGSGDIALENAFRNLAEEFPSQVAVRFGYDNTLAHQIEAGSDFFLMPSRFEPCGLNQLYSLAYGTVPIVRSTGGLADTVKHWTPGSKEATGIVFHDADSKAIEWALSQALELYADSNAYKAVQKKGMKCQFSWKSAAESYLACYKKALNQRT